MSEPLVHLLSAGSGSVVRWNIWSVHGQLNPDCVHCYWTLMMLRWCGMEFLLTSFILWLAANDQTRLEFHLFSWKNTVRSSFPCLVFAKPHKVYSNCQQTMRKQLHLFPNVETESLNLQHARLSTYLEYISRVSWFNRWPSWTLIWQLWERHNFPPFPAI